MRVLVTGGCGFIGSAVVRLLIAETDHRVWNLDALTYAGDPRTLAVASNSDRYELLHGDIRDASVVASAFERADPDLVIHLAAETHVDRSIDAAASFIETNVLGTHLLLEAALTHQRSLPEARGSAFRFLHVSTDEVFGSLGPDDPPFIESTAYDPRSPYSASKAASDHLVRAWHETHGLQTLITNCSNNYGPFQFPEKLIPLICLRSLRGEPLPVYGRGDNVRDWLHVEDHASAILLVASSGETGQTYCVGGRAERTNLDVVYAICDLVDDAVGLLGDGRRGLVRFVEDRPGHDHRYAIDPGRIEGELGWRRVHRFETGLAATVRWYLDNEWWWAVIDGTATARRGRS